MTVGIDMGTGPDGRPATLDLEELLATRLLVQGNSGSGKSHLLRRLLEQSARQVQQAVIDPEGDFVGLADSFGHVVIDAADYDEAGLQGIAARVRAHRVSVVLNLDGLEMERQMRGAAAFLGGLFDADRAHWYPMLVIADEAQLFAPAAAGEISDEARKASLGAMTNLMCRGRKRGLAGVIATQRLAKLAKNVAAEASNFLMGRTFLDIDMARAADLLGMERRQAEMFRDLARGQFIALGPALARRPLAVRIGAVETGGRGGSPKLLPLPETPPADAQDLILTADPAESRPTVPRRMAPLAPTDIMAQLARSQPAPLPSRADLRLEREAERGPLIEAVLRDIVADPEAGYRSVAMLYQDFLVRWRGALVPGEPLDLAAFKRRLAVARAGIETDPADEPDWRRAVALAAELPEDLQSLFLLLARAALTGAPCPGDGAVARVCGSHSPRRARRQLAYLAERGVITCHEEPGGGRVIALPGLGRATAAGDPESESLAGTETIRR